MKFDNLAAIQRVEQLKQAQAQASGKLHLKRIPSKNGILILWGSIILAPFTLGLSTLIGLIIMAYYLFYSKKIFVKNIATGEKFHILKNDWLRYKNDIEHNKNKVVSIFDNEDKKEDFPDF